MAELDVFLSSGLVYEGVTRSRRVYVSKLELWPRRASDYRSRAVSPSAFAVARGWDSYSLGASHLSPGSAARLEAIASTMVFPMSSTDRKVFNLRRTLLYKSAHNLFHDIGRL